MLKPNSLIFILLLGVMLPSAWAITPYGLQIFNGADSTQSLIISVSSTTHPCYQLMLDPGKWTTIYSDSCGITAPIIISTQDINSASPRVICVWPYPKKHDGGVLFKSVGPTTNTLQAMNVSCAIR